MPLTKQAHDYIELRRTAERLAIKAGQYLLSHLPTVSIVQYKDRQDICTTADLGAEQIIVKGIQQQYPDHLIVSEEAGTIGSNNDYRWIIDPLDGTKEYVRNLPMYNTAIAVEHHSKLVAAAIYRPYEQQLFSASLGGGAYSNGTLIQVEKERSLANSFVYSYLPSFARNPNNYDATWQQLANLGKSVYRLRGVADENSALCWLAQGSISACLNLNNPPKWHDIAPGILIALEAGAYVQPGDIDMVRTGKHSSLIVANNRTIWEEIANILRS